MGFFDPLKRKDAASVKVTQPIDSIKIPEKKEPKSACPYCNAILENELKRSKKCPYCNNKIYIKSHQTLFPSKYLTESQVAELNKSESIEHFKSQQALAMGNLSGYKQSGLVKVRIVSPGGCESCIDLMGRILTIEDAIKEMPIPNKKCTFQLHREIPGWCRCRYVPFFGDPKLDTPDSFYEEQKRNASEQLNVVIE